VVLSPHGLRFRKSSALLHSNLFRATIGTPLSSAVRAVFDHDPNASLVTCALFWGEMLGTDSAIWTLRPEHKKVDNSHNAKYRHNASPSAAAIQGLEVRNIRNLNKGFKKAYPKRNWFDGKPC
jgi:hypothetical protein